MNIEEHKLSENFLHIAAAFYSAVVHEFGETDGDKRFIRSMECLHPDLSDEVLLLMLTGFVDDHPRPYTIYLDAVDPSREKVRAVKALREFVGGSILTLKGAIDFLLEANIKSLDHAISFYSTTAQVKVLQEKLYSLGYSIKY